MDIKESFRPKKINFIIIILLIILDFLPVLFFAGFGNYWFIPIRDYIIAPIFLVLMALLTIEIILSVLYKLKKW